MKWLALKDPPEVIPLEDLKPHSEGVACWCKPFDDDGVLVHNALDAREKTYEVGLIN